MVNNLIPPGGTPGVFDPRNPTLLPNFGQALIYDEADPTMPPSIQTASPAQNLAANPRANASATATIGGSVTTGDILTIEMQNTVFPGGVISHTYTTVGGDTVTTIAEALAALFDNDPIAQGFNVETTVAGAVITFNHAGPVGNFTTLVAPNLEKATITIAGTALTGDQIAVLFVGPNVNGGAPVLVTQAVTTGQSATTIAGNLVTALGANAALVAASITAANVAGVITLTVPAAAEPVAISTWVNTASPTATITGTVAAGDILNLIFTGTGIPGSPVTVSYTAVTGDTTTTVAAGLAAAINANAALSGLGYSATNTTNVVNISGNGGNTNGQVRITSSVSPGSETITITTAPTTTSTAGTAATETITFSPTSGIMSGGSGPVIAANNFSFARGSEVSAYFYGNVYNLPYDLVQAMVQQGMPIV